jgi:hypothetical protein
MVWDWRFCWIALGSCGAGGSLRNVDILRLVYDVMDSYDSIDTTILKPDYHHSYNMYSHVFQNTCDILETNKVASY